MKAAPVLLVALAVATLGATGTARAADAEALIKANGCTACHAVDTKLVGPSYKDVATKYHDEKGAEAKLIAKVRDGGSGVWGPVPMPPHPTISEADLKTMVDWVLDRK